MIRESWGPNNYLLGSEEKRIAKQIINHHELGQRLPSLQELSENLNIRVGILAGRLGFMKRAGLLTDSSEGATGYALADKYARWGGPLRHNFHTVTVGNGRALVNRCVKKFRQQQPSTTPLPCLHLQIERPGEPLASAPVR